MHNPIFAVVCLAALAGLTFSQGNGSAAPSGQDVQLTSPARTAWEYKVVSMVERHGDAMDYLKRAFEDGGNPLGMAAKVDEQLAQKTQDLLNEHGQDGWELEHFADWALIFKRPVVE